MNPTPRILLVDDEDDYLYFAERALKKAEVDAVVETAHDGGEALARLGLGVDPAGGRPPEDLVVIFLDVNMPVLNGLEVLRRIRQGRWTREIPVVMVSTSNKPEEVRQSYEAGANSFLVKRTDGTSGTYLAEAARYWAGLNEPPNRRDGQRP